MKPVGSESENNFFTLDMIKKVELAKVVKTIAWSKLYNMKNSLCGNIQEEHLQGRGSLGGPEEKAM